MGTLVVELAGKRGEKMEHDDPEAQEGDEDSPLAAFKSAASDMFDAAKKNDRDAFAGALRDAIEAHLMSGSYDTDKDGE